MMTKWQRTLQRLNNWMTDHEGDILAACVIGAWLSTWLLLWVMAGGR